MAMTKIKDHPIYWENELKSRKHPNRFGLWMRLMRRKAMKPIWFSKHAMPMMSTINQLKSEIALLTQYADHTVYRLNFQTMHYDYISPTIRRLLGYSPLEMKRLDFRSLILQTRIITNGTERLVSFEQYRQKRLSGDTSQWHADFMVRTKHGKSVWLTDISQPMLDPSTGKVVGSYGIIQEISKAEKGANSASHELFELATTDSLTKLANRRLFFDRIDHAIKLAGRRRNELSILLIDIDFFKNINDTYGHDIGDILLVKVAEIIKSCLRSTDLAARIGGEEFGIFLPDTCAKGAYWVAERICTEIARYKFEVIEGHEPLKATVSIGIASNIDCSATDASHLYKYADSRLYIAKNTGRNRVSYDEVNLPVH